MVARTPLSSPVSLVLSWRMSFAKSMQKGSDAGTRELVSDRKALD